MASDTAKCCVMKRGELSKPTRSTQQVSIQQGQLKKKKMAQWVRTQTAPAKDPTLVPSIHVGQFATTCNSSSGGSNVPDLYGYLNTCANTHTETHSET